MSLGANFNQYFYAGEATPIKPIDSAIFFIPYMRTSSFNPLCEGRFSGSKKRQICHFSSPKQASDLILILTEPACKTTISVVNVFPNF